MTTAAAVQDFLANKTLAIVGISRDAKAFSCMAYKELKAKGYRLLLVNPNADTIEGEKCYPSLSALPEKTVGALIFTPVAETEKVVREAAAVGIRHVWIQQGAETPAAVRFGQENGLNLVSGQCIMMHAQPVGSFHNFHRWVAGLFGQLPK